MKLQALHEGIQSRTQKKRRGFRLKRDTNNYQDILHEVATALVPIIARDEADLFHDMGYGDEYKSIEDYFSRLDMQEAAKNFGINLEEVLQQAWDKRWNSE